MRHLSVQKKSATLQSAQFYLMNVLQISYKILFGVYEFIDAFLSFSFLG